MKEIGYILIVIISSYYFASNFGALNTLAVIGLVLGGVGILNNKIKSLND